jgi:hypothetical protein
MNWLSNLTAYFTTAVWLLGSGQLARADQIRNVVQPTGELSMGAGLSHLGRDCVAFVAHLSAADFFLHLTRKETPNGTEYWIRDQRITKFPSELTINVFVVSWPCRKTSTIDPESQQAPLQELRWSVAWKTGIKTRDVKKVEATLSRSSLSEFEKLFVGNTQASNPMGDFHDRTPADYWKLTLAIREQEAPLSDSLILTLATGGGKQIARFSAHL